MKSDLPCAVDVADLPHHVETVHHVDQHDYEKGDADPSGSRRHAVVEIFHQWFIAEIHERSDDGGKAKACKKTGIARQMKGKIGVIPVVEATELFNRGAQRNLAEGDEEKDQTEVKKEMSFFRSTDHKIHGDNGKPIS